MLIEGQTSACLGNSFVLPKINYVIIFLQNNFCANNCHTNRYWFSGDT